MARTHSRRWIAVVAVAGALVLVTPATAQSSHRTAGARHRLDSKAGAIAFELGIAPGFNPRPAPYRITIHTSGTVTITRGKQASTSPTHLTQNTLTGLLRLAEAEHFFTLPASIVPTEPMPDSTFAFITVHTVTETKTVKRDVRARNNAFQELYAVLSAAAGFRT